VTINEDVDIELREAKYKLRRAHKVISDEKDKVYSDVDFTSVFEDLRKNRPFVVRMFYTTLEELEPLKDNPEIKMLYDKVEKIFFDYSRTYVIKKRDLVG